MSMCFRSEGLTLQLGWMTKPAAFIVLIVLITGCQSHWVQCVINYNTIVSWLFIRYIFTIDKSSENMRLIIIHHHFSQCVTLSTTQLFMIWNIGAYFYYICCCLNMYLSMNRDEKRKPLSLMVWNWYHFVATAISHQPLPSDLDDINTRL